jgi:hypothetical protein
MTELLNISTSHRHDVCDVCARTLLRGERTDAFVNGGRRYNVCELCKPHALHEGWIREGALPAAQGAGERAPRRRSLLGRRRPRSAHSPAGRQAPPRSLDDELSSAGWEDYAQPGHGGYYTEEPEPAPALPSSARSRGRAREPRRVHAVPTGDDQKIAVAVDIFNSSQHRRTVASVARSLGPPAVSVAPDELHAGIVWVVVAWELCWYRYEVDLSDPVGEARLDSQGYELGELSQHELLANAGADESGSLALV